MRVGIMQPYFLPYIGYFQLISAVDLFVVYDNIKYTKRGWINRNRFLLNGQDALFTIPLQRGADSLDVRERSIAKDFDKDHLLSRLQQAYRRAPHFDSAFRLIEGIVRLDEWNLFRFIHSSILKVCEYLGLRSTITVSSTVDIDHSLQGQEKVLALCGALGATTYVNAIGGVELYARDAFRAKGIELKFLKSEPIDYLQLGQPFVPWLSIADVLMFNSPDEARRLLDRYQLINGA